MKGLLGKGVGFSSGLWVGGVFGGLRGHAWGMWMYIRYRIIGGAGRLGFTLTCGAVWHGGVFPSRSLYSPGSIPALRVLLKTIRSSDRYLPELFIFHFDLSWLFLRVSVDLMALMDIYLGISTVPTYLACTAAIPS